MINLSAVFKTQHSVIFKSYGLVKNCIWEFIVSEFDEDLSWDVKYHAAQQLMQLNEEDTWALKTRLIEKKVLKNPF